MKKIFALLALLFAVSTYADPGVKCLAGCPQPGESRALRADTQVSDQWWLGPSVGLALQAYDGVTHTWETSLAFQFQYGIKWRPSWSPMPTFLSFDLGFAAGTSNVAVPENFFQITLAPTLTVFDIVAMGYGPRFIFTPAGIATHGVFFLGLSTSFGGP